MESFTMTNHAAIRKQQRGIPESVLDCRMQFGKNSYDNMGGEVLYFDNRARKSLAFASGVRLIHGAPLGLVIYAARNQHTYFEDAKLHEPNLSVFERLATNHGIQSSQPFRHPAFDLQNTCLVSFASNLHGPYWLALVRNLRKRHACPS